MKTFKESFNEVIEAKLKLPKGEKVAKELKGLGRKKKTTAVITTKFNLYIEINHFATLGEIGNVV